MNNQYVEKATFLPNPDVAREQCVQECTGCNKMFSDANIGDVCIAYADPKIWKGVCPLQSNKKFEPVKGKKKMNPLKASKRLRRRGIR